MVAPANGVITANTFGSNYDTVLAGLLGTCGAFSIQACNDDNGGLQSLISFPVTGGATYFLEITSYGGGSGGTLALDVSFAPTPLCGSGPAACRTPTVGGKAYLALTDKADEKDQLQWKWAAGAATSKGEFGNPVTTDQYALCLYDATGLLATLTAPAGGTCGTKACWADKPKGWQYKDEEASPSGITQFQLSAGLDGKAKIQVKGKGLNLPDLDLSMRASPVTVQLQPGSGGVCFGATYSAPALKNDGVQFKDKAD